MTKLNFHRFQVRPFGDNFEQFYDYVRMGQRQRADLSVLNLDIQNLPPGEISANTCM